MGVVGFAGQKVDGIDAVQAEVSNHHIAGLLAEGQQGLFRGGDGGDMMAAALQQGMQALAHALLALQAGAYDYLVKPCDEPALIAAMVERAAERCRLLRQNRTLLNALQTCSAQIDDVGCLLRELAIRDGLTGLYNHRYCHEILVIESARARRHHHGYSLLYVDIDHFRHYNDVHGHPLGDQLLRELGELLKARLRNSDIAARYGGEEFVLLLP